jgi:nitrogen fixation NifU-like protein
MSLYQAEIIAHYHHPQNSGKPEKFAVESKVENLSCGDSCHMFLSLDNQTVTTAHHVTEGCAIAVATASLLSEKLHTAKQLAVLSWGLPELEELLQMQLTPARQKCALISLQAAQQAVAKFMAAEPRLPA